RNSVLLVSAHSPGPWLSWIQLSAIRAPRVAQNFPPPVHPHPGRLDSQSSVLFPTISLCSSLTFRTPSGWYALKPYCPFPRRQLYWRTDPLPSITPAPAFARIVL